MKLISWNVNGLRACLKKGFGDAVASFEADIICVQETKMQAGQADYDFPQYDEYFNDAEKKGYSGTAIFTKIPPVSIIKGIGIPEHDREGRALTLEFPGFYLVNVYTPNSQRDLLRLPYRMEWEDAFREFIKALDVKLPVIICGDLNVAHNEIDLKNPKSNTRNAGFTREERDKLTKLLDSGFSDTYRAFYPDKEGAYTWWSFITGARDRNVGWRIDYFLVSDRLMPKVSDAIIYPEIMGSDHCPVGLLLD